MLEFNNDAFVIISVFALCLLFSNNGKVSVDAQTITSTMTAMVPHQHQGHRQQEKQKGGHRPQSICETAIITKDENNFVSESSNNGRSQPRRSFLLQQGFGWGLLGTGTTFPSFPAGAADAPPEAAATQEGLVSTSKVADILHAVPTFTIVDKKGVPYMVVGEDAKVTGYFFTTYGEADRILKLAKKSGDRALDEVKKEGGERTMSIEKNPWNDARISSVPLDVAVTLVTKSLYSSRKRGGGNYFQISPAESDIEDALELTGKADLQEGKVPVFYFEDFKIDPQDGTGTKIIPLYFRKSELEEAYKQNSLGQNVKNEDMPKIKVSELFAVLSEMVKPGGSTDEDLKNLVIVAPKESIEKSKKCEKIGGKEPPFVLGERNLVL